MWALSVCIPIFNTDVRPLVAELCAQIDKIKVAFIDVVLIDDASAADIKACHQFSNSRVKLIELENNIGRSKIRNLFLAHSTADFLLFIDGDSTVQDPQFLNKYVAYLKEASDVDVLIGASRYDLQPPVYAKRLRWKYSTQRESLNFEKRLRLAAFGFKTNNFLIHREILERIPFEERLQGYGHEDTLFGLQLLQNGVQISHMDNPVWNLNLDTNLVFLQKTDNALRNLLWIYRHYNSPLLLKTNKLLAVYLKFKTKWFLQAFLFMIVGFESVFKRLLLTGRAPLFCFDLYRLSRLSQLDKNTSDKRF
ncbi:MAG: glycosyltransferase family 2 protein [Flavobacteriales bacterium]